MADTNGSIENTLAAYIREECLPRNSAPELGEDTNLIDTGIMDSAGIVVFVNFIETTFAISIPDEDLLPEHFVSISSAARYVRARQEARHG
jgi:acyl carrier protein